MSEKDNDLQVTNALEYLLGDAIMEVIPINKSYPGAIKKIRDKTGLSQKAFAEKYGLSFRTVQQWEQGVSAPPGHVARLLAYAVAMQDLYRSDEKKERKGTDQDT